MDDRAPRYAFSPRLAFRVWQREVTLYRELWKSVILGTIADPIMYLLALGYGLGAYMTRDFEGVSYMQFIAPGLVASSVMLASSFETLWPTYRRIYEKHLYAAMVTTPASIEDVAAGEVFWAATRGTLYAVIMLVVLGVLGLVQSWWALLVPPVAFLGATGFATLALSYTASVKAMDSLSPYYTLFLTPLFLFSGIFFPLGRIPEWAQWIAHLSPLYHMVAVVRGLVLGHVGLELGFSLLVLAGFVIVLWPLPRRILSRRLFV